jgi:hypothetical protein
MQKKCGFAPFRPTDDPVKSAIFAGCRRAPRQPRTTTSPRPTPNLENGRRRRYLRCGYVRNLGRSRQRQTHVTASRLGCGGLDRRSASFEASLRQALQDEVLL